MAVVEMKKLNLAAMAYDKDVILNSLQRTGAVEVKLHYDAENTRPLVCDCEALREKLNAAEGALELLSAKVAQQLKGRKDDTSALGEVEISYSEFMSAGEKSERAEILLAKINSLSEEERECEAELAKLSRSLESAGIYSEYKSPLTKQNTAHAQVKLGTFPAALRQNFEYEFEKVKLSAYDVIAADKENALVEVVFHRDAREEAENALQSVNFVPCPFDGENTGEELYNSLKSQESTLREKLASSGERWAELKDGVRELKIYCDFLAFELEKAELAEKMRATDATFLLEAYVPADAEELVKGALQEVTGAVYTEFSAPGEDEIPPTLLKNNKAVKNFEAVTNMYSPPNYREFDPNTVMAFFYSVFLGFIMADIGYGLLMLLGGMFVKLKIRREGMLKSLGGVFAIGGIFTVIWGFLFNSFFGFALLPFKVMPDLQGAEMSWTIDASGGIKVPALLIISMLIGVVQLCAGYVCLAVQNIRRGKIADGILDGGVWALFSVGVELAVIGFVKEFNIPVLKLVGGITAGVTLLTAVLTAGRKEKLLGKFTKGFGSAYGVINYASDILSYARLYGLMLAGAVIADIITSNSVSLMSSGNVAYIIIGALIMLIGHIFNLAIGLLGAYIHDARLQYVEFYGRFYEGEGELFTPLGSTHKHVYVMN